ncbi:MAG: hypothetical protein WHT82_06250 [Limisphaera sp.]
MDLPVRPADLARAWLELAEQETEAIQQQDWSRLATCQQRISQLQQRWDQWNNGACPSPGPHNPEPPDPELRQLLIALIERERFNQELLNRQRAALEAEYGQLTRAAWHLRRLQQIRPAQNLAGWSRFS